MRTRRVAGLLGGMLLGLSVVAARAQAPTDSGAFVHFVPNSQAFWDFSKRSTNYGPNYRDIAGALWCQMATPASDGQD